MRDIKLTINKPYSRDDDAALVKPTQVEFSCLFDDVDQSLTFANKLMTMFIEFKKGDPDAR